MRRGGLSSPHTITAGMSLIHLSCRAVRLAFAVHRMPWKLEGLYPRPNRAFALMIHSPDPGDPVAMTPHAATLAD